uniref:Uncharacterized protein n=1 Tax=Anguilla anguilla TaxID=7936 RepID=A0A0E9UNA7_ANGAN
MCRSVTVGVTVFDLTALMPPSLLTTNILILCPIHADAVL